MLVNASETYEVSENIKICGRCNTEKVEVIIHCKEYVIIPIEELPKLIECLNNISDNFYKKPLVKGVKIGKPHYNKRRRNRMRPMQRDIHALLAS